MPLIPMIQSHRVLALAILVVAATLAGCNGPRVVQEAPVLMTGDRVPMADDVIVDAQAREVAARAVRQSEHDAVTARAIAGCTPAICDAIGRGEVALGMTSAQVMAATRSAPDAWSVRRTANSVVMTPASLDALPTDAQGQLAIVQFDGDVVSSVSRRDRTGLRVESRAADTTRTARAAAVTNAIVREGDDGR